MRHRMLTDPRDHFVSVESELKAETEQHDKERDDLTTAFNEEFKAECRKAGMKTFDMQKARKRYPELYIAVLEPYQALSADRAKQHRERYATLKERLHTVAKWVPIRFVANVTDEPPDAPWRLHYACRTTVFNSQTDAQGYAEAACQARKWTVGYIEPKVLCKVVWREDSCGLYVAVEEDLDVRVLQARAYEGVPLDEFVRRCWARAWNPRVLDPFLPHGLEEKIGLDYQGRNSNVDTWYCARCGEGFNLASPAKECPSCQFDLRPYLPEPADAEA